MDTEHYREILLAPLPLPPAAGTWLDTRHDKNIHYQLQLLPPGLLSPASIIHTNLGDIDILKARVRMWNYLKCKLQIAIKGTNCSFNIEIDA